MAPANQIPVAAQCSNGINETNKDILGSSDLDDDILFVSESKPSPRENQETDLSEERETVR